MQALNLPSYPAKVVKRADKLAIWDILRKKYVSLTPEEWVRQHFIHYMIEYRGYPMGRLANEVQICLNNTLRRCDTVFYHTDLTPRIIVEYKAPHVPITQEVFDQVARYNLVLDVEYLVVSNGIEHFCCQIERSTRQYRFIPELPHFNDLE